MDVLFRTKSSNSSVQNTKIKMIQCHGWMSSCEGDLFWSNLFEDLVEANFILFQHLHYEKVLSFFLCKALHKTGIVREVSTFIKLL